jgi:predicted transcriptional regulator
MKVLLSIKPEYAERIFNGSKKFEYRKAIFKNRDVKTIVVYVTKPIGKIIGEFDIEKVLIDTPSQIWKKTKKYSGIKESFFDEYFKDRERAYAIKVSSVKKYAEPICPYATFQNFFPPQSFMYLNQDILESM